MVVEAMILDLGYLLPIAFHPHHHPELPVGVRGHGLVSRWSEQGPVARRVVWYRDQIPRAPPQKAGMGSSSASPINSAAGEGIGVTRLAEELGASGVPGLGVKLHPYLRVRRSILVRL